MTLTSLVSLLAVASTQPVDFSPPPLVDAPTSTQEVVTAPPRQVIVARTPEAPPAQCTEATTARAQVTPEKAPDEVPVLQVAALATGSLVSTTAGSEALFGARGEVDLFRFGVNVTYGRLVTSSLVLSDTVEVVGLAGWSVMANRWGRVRVLGGLDVRAATAGVTVGPAVGANARVGFSMLQVDLSTTLTPFPFRQLEARAALVLKGGLFELHGGYQARFSDTSSTGTLATLFSTAPLAGPYVAVGVAL
jgi:hypothetical protein